MELVAVRKGDVETAWLRGIYEAMENNEDLKLKTHRESCEDGLIVDKIKLGEPGYKERYYAEKFGEESVKSIEEVKKDLVSFSSSR
ncbi:hypothetical protein IEQ34_002289 [Dendrobium chrysotoxum]|uniref:Xrn1 helical domain-containing protein n=1 Tax=Dendrobium chrysotoxum TaxID=161865 RepID=A0AAV7HKX0_DENCH|nr:hypothetical protein IEQ34_002289 [Dendrobium chrysotoxum]